MADMETSEEKEQSVVDKVTQVLKSDWKENSKNAHPGRVVDRNTEVNTESVATNQNEFNFDTDLELGNSNVIGAEETEVIDEGDFLNLTCPSCQFNESLDKKSSIKYESIADVDSVVESFDKAISCTEQKDGMYLIAFAEMSMGEKSRIKNDLKSFESVIDVEFVGNFECLIEVGMTEATCGHCGFSWTFTHENLESDTVQLLTKQLQFRDNMVESQEQMLEAKQKIIEGLISYGSKKMRKHPAEKFKNKFDLLNESVSYAMSNEVNIPSDLEEQIEWHVKNYDFDDFDVEEPEHDLTEPVSDEEFEELHNRFFE
jgi:predicted nucleic-acid-binding Zn-ribbon protein